MLPTIVVIAIFVFMFLGATYTIRLLRKAKLKSSIHRDIETGSKKQAAKTLLSMIRKDPFDVDKRRQAAQLLIETGDLSEAVVQLQSILSYSRDREDIDKKEIYGLLADCHKRMGNIDDAYKSYTLMRKVDPDDVLPYIELGKLEVEKEAPNEALQYFKKALSIQKDNYEVLKEIGIVFYQLKKFADALRVLKLAYSMNAQDPEVHFYLAEVNNGFDNHNDALKHYLKARVDARFAVASLIGAGKLLGAYKRYADALKVLSLALKSDGLQREQRLEISYEIAEVYLAQGDIQEALKQWDRILSHAPNYRDVRAKVEKYEKMKYSNVLKSYMAAPQSSFQKLCRHIAVKFADNVVIMRIGSLRDSSVEIFAQAVYKHRNMTILFKFFRGNTKVGQLAVREFYEKVKETKASLGICITSAEFTEEALSFIEGRAIELYSGAQFNRLLKRVEMKQTAPKSSG
jgi:tetratricopeptide (TPR) repeat protein